MLGLWNSPWFPQAQHVITAWYDIKGLEGLYIVRSKWKTKLVIEVKDKTNKRMAHHNRRANIKTFVSEKDKYQRNGIILAEMCKKKLNSERTVWGINWSQRFYEQQSGRSAMWLWTFWLLYVRWINNPGQLSDQHHGKTVWLRQTDCLSGLSDTKKTSSVDSTVISTLLYNQRHVGLRFLTGCAQTKKKKLDHYWHSTTKVHI